MANTTGPGGRNRPNRTTIARRATLTEPDRIAQSFLKEEFTDSTGRRLLHNHHDRLYRYTGNCYAAAGDTGIRALFHDYFIKQAEATGITIRSMAAENAAWQSLLHRCPLDEQREMQSWLRLGEPATAQHDFVAFNNCILNLGTGERLEHTPEWFSTTVLPFDYDPEARCDEWQRTLESIFSDEDLRMLLQEWFGYCLTLDTSRHKFVLFEGIAGGGKGLIAGVQEKLIGNANVSHVRLDMFGQRFYLTQTHNKLLNVVDEVDKVEHFDEGVFKTFTGGGSFLYEDKGKKAFSVKATAKVLILANERPPIYDESEGMWRRMLLLKFRKSFIGLEDYGLPGRLERELSGIFNWALAGRTRLYTAQKFTEPTASVKEREQYKLESSPAKMFLTEFYELDKNPDGDGVVAAQMYTKYVMYCKDFGYKPLSLIKFNKEVQATFPNATKVRRRVATADKAPIWDGVKERTD